MDQRFSMLPGGGLYQRYRRWRAWRDLERAVDDCHRAMIAIGRAADQAVEAIADFWRAYAGQS